MQPSSDSVSHSPVEQTKNEVLQRLSLQQLGLDEIQCLFHFVIICTEAGESAQLCQKILEGLTKTIWIGVSSKTNYSTFKISSQPPINITRGS